MADQDNLPLVENEQYTSFPYRTVIILLLIISLAAFLRLVGLCKLLPPGLHRDEAANAWSAYCLLKTGKDFAGVSWPVFYARNTGGNSSTLYIYLLMPFQAIGGLNAYTTRLPGALGGIFTVWLIYFVGKRLFNTATGLVAAALLAIDPWHLQHCRWGHEASLTPLLSLAPLALLLFADMPLGDNKIASPRPLAAAIAGALTGVACYGYFAVRVFVPVFIFLVVLFTLPRWRQILKSRQGVFAVLVFIIAFSAFFGPLIWQHIFHPEGISRHFLYLPNRLGSASFAASIKNIVIRYIRHFGFYFLFIEGDTHETLSPPGIGQFHWYMLPLMLAGLISLILKFKSSSSARVILAFVLAYPAGDCLAWGPQFSIIRSAPGLCGLILLASVGAVDVFFWLRNKNRRFAVLAAATFSLAVVGINGPYLYNFYSKFSRQPLVYNYFSVDLIEACDWLKPRFDDFDAVFCTAKSLNMPHIITLVALGYDPNRWFSEPREFTTQGEWDYYTRYGKMHFMYENIFKKPAERYRPDRVLFILRPEEVSLENPSLRVIHKILRPDGQPVLLICRP